MSSSLPGTVHLALIYGSIAKRADTSASDVDDQLLEALIRVTEMILAKVQAKV